MKMITLKKKNCIVTLMMGKSSSIASMSGNNMNLMKPICAECLVTLSRSMKAATGSPSSFSMSLCIDYVNTQVYQLFVIDVNMVGSY